MFVITIGPIGKRWGTAIKLTALGIVILLLALIIYQVVAPAFAPVAIPHSGGGGSGTDGEALPTTAGAGAGYSFWDRFLGTLQTWFRYGF